MPLITPDQAAILSIPYEEKDGDLTVSANSKSYTIPYYPRWATGGIYKTFFMMNASGTGGGFVAFSLAKFPIIEFYDASVTPQQLVNIFSATVTAYNEAVPSTQARHSGDCGYLYASSVNSSALVSALQSYNKNKCKTLGADAEMFAGKNAIARYHFENTRMYMVTPKVVEQALIAEETPESSIMFKDASGNDLLIYTAFTMMMQNLITTTYREGW